MRAIDHLSNVQKSYVILTKWFNTTFIGILVGVMTSAAVNILTGEKHLSLFFGLTVILYFVMCIALYFMLLFRQELDENEATRKMTEPDEGKRWQNSCRWDEPEFVKRFYKIFSVFMVTLVGAVWLNINANLEGFDNDETDKQILTSKIDSIIKSQAILVDSTNAINKKVDANSKRQDSIIKLVAKKNATKVK